MTRRTSLTVIATEPAARQSARDAQATKLKRAIQAARRSHPGLAEDDDWRDLLECLTGGRSLSEMNRAKLGLVLDHLNGKTSKPANQVAGDTPLARKVARLWNVLDLLGGVDADEAAGGLRGFVQRQTGIASADWLGPDQASSIVEALRARIARCGWDCPAGKAALSDKAQRAYATALHQRLVAIGGTTLDRDTWLIQNAGVRVLGFATTPQIKAGVNALESAVRKAIKGGSNVG
ncbi:MAG: regulatory protein GemA [Ferrovibrionaceae bacterium]